MRQGHLVGEITKRHNLRWLYLYYKRTIIC